MEKLKRYDLNCNIFDVYNYDGLSMQELLCQFFTKINECIKTSNEAIDLAEWLVNEGIKQEVAIKLTDCLNDDTFKNLINVTLFENLNKKIDNVNEQLNTKANESDLIVERNRINLLTKVQNGETNGNTELLDIRVGLDGQEYELAGNYVRKINSDLEKIGLIGLNIYDKNNVTINQYPSNGATVVNGEYSELQTLVGRSTTKPYDLIDEDNWSFVCKNVEGMIIHNGNGSRIGYISGVSLSEGYFLFKYDASKYRYCGFRFATDNVDNVEIYKGDTVPYEKYRFNGKKIVNDVSLLENNNFVEVKNKVDEMYEMYDNSEVGFFLGNNIYFLKNTLPKRVIPYRNLIAGYNSAEYRLRNYNDRYNNKGYNDSICKENLDTAGWLKLVKRTNDSKQLDIITTYWKCVDPSTKDKTISKNILMIGDSFTDLGYLPCLIQKMLADNGFTNFKFIGHKSDNKYGVDVKNSGCGGYRVTDFIKTDNSLGGGTSRPNPFLKNGNVLLSNTINEVPDIVVIELGINDLLNNDYNIEQMIADLTTLINIVKQSNSTVKIYCVGYIFLSDINGNTDPVYHNLRIQKANKSLQVLCEKTDNCDFIDVNTMFNTEIGYPYELVSIFGSEEKFKNQTDYLHPSELGFKMEAENIVAKIIYDLE